MTLPSPKTSLRRTMLARLRAMPPALRESKSAALRQKLLHLLPQEGLCIGLYASLPHEVDLMPLLAEAPGLHYAFPRCLPGQRLRFHEVASPEDDLIPGAHGILAPRPGLPAIDAGRLDALIIPGVAFTPSGARLGYGGGYYDRFLPTCPQARLIALAFAEQMLDSLPTEGHDVPIPLVLSA